MIEIVYKSSRNREFLVKKKPGNGKLKLKQNPGNSEKRDPVSRALPNTVQAIRDNYLLILEKQTPLLFLCYTSLNNNFGIYSLKSLNLFR